MPRGDGRKPGEPRPNRKRTDSGQYVPKGLARRQKAFDESKTDSSDHRPGSQQGK